MNNKELILCSAISILLICDQFFFTIARGFLERRIDSGSPPLVPLGMLKLLCLN
jgi:hypothetical protein